MKIFFVGDTENKHTVLKNRYLCWEGRGGEGRGGEGRERGGQSQGYHICRGGGHPCMGTLVSHKCLLYLGAAGGCSISSATLSFFKMWSLDLCPVFCGSYCQPSLGWYYSSGWIEWS